MRTSHLVLVLGALVGSGALFGAYKLSQAADAIKDPGPSMFMFLVGAGALAGSALFAHNNKD